MPKARGTDGSLLPTLPWTFAALAFAIAPHLPFLPFWVTGAFVIAATWRLSIERRRGALPPAWLRALLALGCFLGVLATYDTISGVGPGSALLAVMASLKLLETRRRRDQFVLLFIAIFLVMSSLLREQYLWSMPYLLFGILFITTAWLRLSGDPSDSLKHSFATGGRLMAYAAPMAIAMWIFFPRIATPFWSVPIDTSQGSTGISDTMSPGDISSLSQSDEVAFRVKFDGALPEPRNRYWRGLVLRSFNGRTWSAGEPSIGRKVSDQIRVRGEPIRYRITLEPSRQQWVFALDLPASWTLSQTFMGPQQQLVRVHPIDQRVVYDVTSYTDYRSDTDLPTQFQAWNMYLPPGTNPRTVELARQMREEATDDAAFVTAVLNRFNREEYFYTLQPPPLGNNPVDRFLFDTQRGFCEHYASAFAVMMRAAGIPARVVVGYQGGEVNRLGDDYLIVRQSDAHAWNEVWLDGVGWRRIDPTAAVAPERVDYGLTNAAFDGFASAWGLNAPSRWLHNLGLTWDAINARWNEWVLGYGPENQDSLMRKLGFDEPGWRNMLLTLIAVVTVLLLGISLVLMWRFLPPPRDRATVLYRRFVRKSGLEPAVGETPAVFATRVIAEAGIAADVVNAITNAYLGARYEEDHKPALGRLETAVRGLS